MDARRHPDHSPAVGAAAAAIALATSAIVLVGWTARIPDLVQIRPEWVPVQPNAAVGLLLVGLGLLLALRGFTRCAAGLGIATVALAALTAAQSLFRFDLGIDGALIGAWPETLTPEPGRMAPNTAAGLFLLGAAITGAAARLRALAAVCSVGAWALGVGALLGYAIGLEAAYDWGSPTAMAPVTAGNLMLVSSALLWVRRPAFCREAGGAWYGPLVAGLGSVAISLLFYQALLVRQEDQIESTVDATAQRIRMEIRVAVQAQRHALAGLAREWDDTFFKRRSAWESDVRIAIAKSQWIASIAWFEPDGELVWRYPPDGDAPRVVLPPPNAKPEVAHSWARAMRLADGSRGFALVAPLLDSGAVYGWLHGVFRSREFFGQLSPMLPEGYGFQIDTRRSMIYDGGLIENFPSHWVRRLALGDGSDVTVTLHPTPEWLAQQRSLLPQVILAAGFVLSGLLVFALRAAQTSAAHAVALEGEVRAHEEAEEEIRKLNLELEERVSRRTAELQRTNDELKGFASFLSHELRQPVAAQDLWADLLETEYASSLDEQGREYLAQIRRHIRRTTDLIAAQLVLAEVASAPIEIGFVDLDRIVEELRRDLKADLDGAGATLQQSKLPGVPGDSRLLYQLFRNLLENSIKYRRPGVTLEIRLSGHCDETSAEILYADNGRGFAPADAQRIFGVHERVDESGSSGLGLGLAVCRRIMERCGGSIDARGEPGRGASFRIRFPLAQPVARDPAAD